MHCTSSFAGSTKLQGGSDRVPRYGDDESDSYGNTLFVAAAGKLRSG
ncbi:hypothetical protein [Sphingomonas spermidinifaciens]|nr:hypothetical protein [Sphingomonas spermidinifaciens]